MERYIFLDHTSDAKFQAFGRTLEEAFRHAALATASLMWDHGTIEPVKEHRIMVKGRDLKQLLYNFLEEILFLLDTENFLLHSANEVKIAKKGKSYLLEAFFKGNIFSDKYEIYGSVKAITYNEMEIKENHPVILQVVVDI